jgi:hypothetical protein
LQPTNEQQINKNTLSYLSLPRSKPEQLGNRDHYPWEGLEEQCRVNYHKKPVENNPIKVK